MIKLFTFFHLLFLGIIATVNAQTIVNILPEKDNTLYESASGTLSNGSGIHIFTGVDDNGNIKRALIKFDIVSNIPAGATIVDVQLLLTMDKTIAGATNVSVHTLLVDWGEAGSVAGGSGGGGAPAQPGDATWLHTFSNTMFWTTPGGDYDPIASATTSVAGNGNYNWTSPQLISDVQNWLDQPLSNNGWIIIGDETTSPTAKRFASREHGTVAIGPVLSVTYTIPCTPPDVPTVTAGGSTFCSGQPVALIVSGNLNDATDWFLYSDTCGGTPLASNSSGNFTVSPTSTTTYFIRGEGGCVTPGSCATIGITPFTVDTSVTLNMTTLTATAAGATYQWVDCNNNFAHITGQTNQSFTPSINGNYAVIVQENGCIDTSGCRNVIIIGINENKPEIKFNVFPNPFKEELIIELADKNLSGLQVEIVNSEGKVIQKSDLINKEKIRTSSLISGIYLIRIIEKKNNIILGEKTIVKQ